jgi:tape measure domain-containing protein
VATERLTIEVDEKGARVVKRNLQGIGEGAKQAGGAAKLLKRALVAAASAAIIQQYVRLSDTFTSLQNRIRNTVDSQTELAAVTDKLAQLANDTRSSFQSTAELYTRVATASQELGISQQQVITFTKSLNQAILLSGATAAEAKAGVIQLSQGLASGALRGDELRSVLEGLPVVADTIAKEMGVTRGELRELGSEGKVTAEIVLEAFKNAEQELQSGFGKTVPTVGQAMTVVRNKTLMMVGSFNESTGLIDAIAQGILSMSDGLEVAAEAFEFIGDVGVVVVEELAAALAPAIEWVKSWGVTWEDVGQLIIVTVAAVVRTIAQYVDIIAKGWGDFFMFLDRGFGDIFEGILTLVADFVNKAIGIIQGFIEGVRVAINAVRRSLGQEELQAFDLIQFDPLKVGRLGRNLGRDLAQGLQDSDLTGAVDRVIEGVEARQLERQQREAQQEREGSSSLDVAPSKPEEKIDFAAFNEYLDLLRQENDLLKTTAEQRLIERAILKAEKELKRDLTATEREQITVATQRKAALTELNSIIEQGQLTQQQYNTALDMLNQLLDNGVINSEQFKVKLGELDSAMGQSVDELSALEMAGRQVFQSMFGAFDRALGDSKMTFRDFIDSVLSDLARLAAQQALLNVVKAVGGQGGIELLGLATGGSFEVGGSGGTDSQVVAFRATPGERVDVSTPGQQRAAEVNTAPPVIKIVNVTNPDEIPEAMSSSEGEQVIVNTITRNRETVRQAIS